MGRVITNPTGGVIDASEVKILYESNENTNAYTDNDKASLDEVKDAIDTAKKIIEITFPLDGWTDNSDGTYSQTISNSEIKSSMNPDLISMLSSDATSDEQKVYVKNFSILCQGVGSTADGSVTYKIYKQMTADITVGLTRLGGVKQVESEAKVDDVKVGGVSVVTDKIANIPAIPNVSGLVPYTDATKSVDLNGHGIGSTGADPDSSGAVYMDPNGFFASNTKFVAQTEDSHAQMDGNSINFSDTQAGYVSALDATTLQIARSKDSKTYVATLQVKSLVFTDPDKASGSVRGLADPTNDTDAANKKYVDNKVAEVTSTSAPKIESYNFIFPAGYNVAAGAEVAVGFEELVPSAWKLFTSKKPTGKSIRIGGCMLYDKSLGSGIKILGTRIMTTPDGDDCPVIDIGNATDSQISLTSAATIKFNMTYDYI